MLLRARKKNVSRERTRKASRMANHTLQSVKHLFDGHAIPLLGLGTYLVEPEAVKTALELGYRLIDTASLYESDQMCTCIYRIIATCAGFNVILDLEEVGEQISILPRKYI